MASTNDSKKDKITIFNSLAGSLKHELLEIMKSDKEGRINPENQTNFRSKYAEILTRLRDNHRKIYIDIEKGKEEINIEKSKQETISNYYEGLLYEKNHTIREIGICKNLQTYSLNKINRVKGHLALLEQSKDEDTIKKLSKEIDQQMDTEFTLRKKLKGDFEGIIEKTVEAQDILKDKKKTLEELPKMVGKMFGQIKACYEQFTGGSLIGLEDDKTLENCPRQINSIYYKIQDFITENSEQDSRIDDQDSIPIGEKRDFFTLITRRDSNILQQNPNGESNKNGDIYGSNVSTGQLWSRNLKIQLKEVEDTKLQKFQHANYVNQEINLQALSEKDGILKDFYNRIDESHFDAYKLYNKIGIDFVYQKNYKAILVKMYDIETGHLLNDEYLSVLYSNTDKINTLLNMNISDVNLTAISQQLQAQQTQLQQQQQQNNGNSNTDGAQNNNRPNQQNTGGINSPEWILHENYLLIPSIQKISENYTGRKHTIKNFLNDLYFFIRKKCIMNYMIDSLKRDKCIPQKFLKVQRQSSSQFNSTQKIDNNSEQRQHPYFGISNNILSSYDNYSSNLNDNKLGQNQSHNQIVFNSCDKISHDDSVRYLETPKHLKKIMKGRKPEESKMDSILSKTKFLEDLSQKQKLIWSTSIGNEELLKYFNLAELSSNKNSYMKQELTGKCNKQIIVICKIPKYLLTE